MDGLVTVVFAYIIPADALQVPVGWKMTEHLP